MTADRLVRLKRQDTIAVASPNCPVRHHAPSGFDKRGFQEYNSHNTGHSKHGAETH